MRSDPAAPPQFLQRAGHPDLAYRWLPGTSPAVVFLGGFVSDMTGTKAVAVGEHCARRGWSCLRLDYSGHGASGGTFADGTIGRWAEDALAVIDAVTAGPLLLVGSSMGAWIATLVCRARPDRVAGLVGVAAAPGFTEDLLWAALPDTARDRLRETGRLPLPGGADQPPVEIGWELIADGRRRDVLESPTPLSGPVRLLHGLADADVPWQTSVRLAAALDSPDLTVTLVKGGDHRLCGPEPLALILGTVDEVHGRIAGAET